MLTRSDTMQNKMRWIPYVLENLNPIFYWSLEFRSMFHKISRQRVSKSYMAIIDLCCRSGWDDYVLSLGSTTGGWRFSIPVWVTTLDEMILCFLLEALQLDEDFQILCYLHVSRQKTSSSNLEYDKISHIWLFMFKHDASAKTLTWWVNLSRILDLPLSSILDSLARIKWTSSRYHV